MPSTRRRQLTLAALTWSLALPRSARATTLPEALARAHALREQAVRDGDQPYGAVVWLDGRIVGEAPSRVVSRGNDDAHAEREALREAQARLRRDDLSGAWLVSSARPCARCERAAARAGIARLVYGDGHDGGAPRAR